MGIAAGVVSGVMALLSAAPAAAVVDSCDANGTFCPATSAPEPATLSLLALAVAGFSIARRRK